MTSKQLSQYILHSEELEKAPISELDELIAKYPYFQTPRLLLAKALKLQESHKFEDALRNASVYAADRTVLYTFINRRVVSESLIKDIKILLQAEKQKKQTLSDANIVEFEKKLNIESAKEEPIFSKQSSENISIAKDEAKIENANLKEIAIQEVVKEAKIIVVQAETVTESKNEAEITPVFQKQEIENIRTEIPATLEIQVDEKQNVSVENTNLPSQEIVENSIIEKQAVASNLEIKIEEKTPENLQKAEVSNDVVTSIVNLVTDIRIAISESDETEPEKENSTLEIEASTDEKLLNLIEAPAEFVPVEENMQEEVKQVEATEDVFEFVDENPESAENKELEFSTPIETKEEVVQLQTPETVLDNSATEINLEQITGEAIETITKPESSVVDEMQNRTSKYRTWKTNSNQEISKEEVSQPLGQMSEIELIKDGIAPFSSLEVIEQIPSESENIANQNSESIPELVFDELSKPSEIVDITENSRVIEANPEVENLQVIEAKPEIDNTPVVEEILSASDLVMKRIADRKLKKLMELETSANEQNKIEVTNPVENKSNAKIDLIENFIQKEPHIRPIRISENTVTKDVSEGSVIENNFISESLANIYFTQKLYSKSLEVYEKLILKYPEKSSYFTGEIEKIKTITNNQ